MLAGFIKLSKKSPTMSELEHAIMRNFDGLHELQQVNVFRQFLADTELSKVGQFAGA